jgi:hypothetical protein
LSPQEPVASKGSLLSPFAIRFKKTLRNHVKEVPKIKQNKSKHAPLRSSPAGMLAAEAAFSALTSDETAGTSGDRAISLTSYPDAIKASWAWDELHVARNIRPVSPCNRVILSVRLFGLLH